MTEAGKWLAEVWAERLGPAISAMAGAPSQAVVAGGSVPPHESAEELWWRQELNAAPGAAVHVCFSRGVWHEIGAEVLRAAGLDEASEEDVRGTFLEVLQQSISQLTAPLGARAGREVELLNGGAPAGGPDELEWHAVQVIAAGRNLGTAWLAGTPAILKVLTAEQAEVKGEPPSSAASKKPRTLDLLMEVELPVGVSFGRALMRLKDAIKLTTGSIVELNRSVAEPVEIVVNNCVIARGEVVVVEGNYGVRIQQIISREERLRTLF